MILIADAGNTNTAFAVFEVADDVQASGIGAGQGRIIGRVSVPTRLFQDEAVFKSEFPSILERLLPGKVTVSDKVLFSGCIISSVIPEADDLLAKTVQEFCGVTPLFASPALDSGIRMRGGDYELSKLGMDRLADMAGARLLCDGAFMVVDFGSCSTFSIVDADGVFEGGMICAGIQMSMDAMADYTAKLPRLRARDYQNNAQDYQNILKSDKIRLIGHNTVECMLSGSVIAAAAILDGFHSRVEDELGYSIQIVVTGGAAPLVLPWCQHPLKYDADLLMRGLAELYCRRNFTKPEASSSS